MSAAVKACPGAPCNTRVELRMSHTILSCCTLATRQLTLADKATHSRQRPCSIQVLEESLRQGMPGLLAIICPCMTLMCAQDKCYISWYRPATSRHCQRLQSPRTQLQQLRQLHRPLCPALRSGAGRNRFWASAVQGRMTDLVATLMLQYPWAKEPAASPQDLNIHKTDEQCCLNK